MRLSSTGTITTRGLNYWPEKEASWDGNKFLYMALEDGFLKAENTEELKFSIMWCNHNLGANVKGAVKPENLRVLNGLCYRELL